MKGLIKFSLDNYHAIIVMGLSIILLGMMILVAVPIDILPVFKSPAVQVLTFYGGMPAEGMEKDITNRMERWTGQANGMKRQESRSIMGASIVRNYFFDDIDPNGALTQVNSLALATLPNLPPGTLPPVVLPFDPTSTTPVALVALDSATETESILYDVGRYEVRNMIMQIPGASAPVVIGGKLRAVMLYLNQTKMQSRGHSPADIMDAVDKFNLFFPSGDVRIGDIDYALSSNSMFSAVERMGDIPLKARAGNSEYLRDVATPRDAAFIQTNIVRVNGRRQVYIPVYRQVGASTLSVVENLRAGLQAMAPRLSRPDIKLLLVMDQSVYVRASISALIVEAGLGAALCAAVIMLFLGSWRMTIIAVITLPLSVLVAIVCLYFTGNTINVMTLAGLTLAIGPMIDSAIICLENTHRHLGLGATPKDAAFLGANEVAMPELVSTICTFLVLVPLIFIPGTGKFLFLPMTLAVMFAMTTAYLLSRTLVPCFSYLLLGGQSHHAAAGGQGGLAGAFAVWERMIEASITAYTKLLTVVLRFRFVVIGGSFLLLALVLFTFAPILRRDFFPEADGGAFEIAVRAQAGLRIDRTEALVEKVEAVIRKNIPEHDLMTVISEIGLTADWSAGYTPNSGPQDCIMKVQLKPHRERTAQDYVRILRKKLNAEFSDLEFAFDAGGLVRGALNEGASTPINIQLRGRDKVRFKIDDKVLELLKADNLPQPLLARLASLKADEASPNEKKFLAKLRPLFSGDEQIRWERLIVGLAKNEHVLYEIAKKIKDEVKKVKGIVDTRIIQRLDAPELTVVVDRAKAAQLGLTQDYIMKNLIAATNSSITFNKKNFWIDSVSHNQYFVGVQYPEKKLETIDDLLNIPIVTPNQTRPITLRQVATIHHGVVPTEIHHVNLMPAIDLTMSIEDRDLGHICDDVHALLSTYGVKKKDGVWQPYDPHTMNKEPADRKFLGGAEIVMSGEYSRMQSTFNNLGWGLAVAATLIYFLMVGLDRSFIVPLTVMLTVPLCLIGVLPFLYFTGSAINVQSLLGIIFIVGIKVANTVLMTDYAQELRRHEGLTPTQAILKAASLRVRPVTMTALAAFFAMIPTALALEKGSEANAPLARAILGGLLAGEPATLFILPALYSSMVRDSGTPPPPGEGHEGHEGTPAVAH